VKYWTTPQSVGLLILLAVVCATFIAILGHWAEVRGRIEQERIEKKWAP
jgi:hypothetical protein